MQAYFLRRVLSFFHLTLHEKFEIHKGFRRRTAIVGTRFFPGFALAELCGAAKEIFDSERLIAYTECKRALFLRRVPKSAKNQNRGIPTLTGYYEMNIQIFGKSKCFETKKAERWFKERRIKYQYIDILKYGMSRGELTSVKNAVGLEAMADPADQDYPIFQYLASGEAKLDKLFEVPYLIKTPEIWKDWK